MDLLWWLWMVVVEVVDDVDAVGTFPTTAVFPRRTSSTTAVFPAMCKERIDRRMDCSEKHIKQTAGIP